MQTVPRSVVAAALLFGAVAACGPLKQYFPSRDEVYKPVPVTLGEELVAGGDTSYVLVGRGYRVVTRDRDLLPDAKSSLDRVSFAFRRFMSVDPPTVDVRLQLLSRKRRGARPDSSGAAATAARAGTADSGRVVTMVAWRDGDRRAGTGGAMGGARLPATALVRSWLSALTDSIVHAPPPPRFSARSPIADSAANGSGGIRDDGRAPAAAAGPAAAPPPREDPRIPDWIERGIPALVAGSPDPDYASAQLARQKDRLIPLRTLVTQRAPGGDQPAAGGRGDDDYRGPAGGGARGRDRGRAGRTGRTLEGRQLFDAEAVSVVDYLAEREGAAFVGDLFRTVVAGGTLEDALRGTHSVAHDVAAFERGWRGWLDEQGARVEER